MLTCENHVGIKIGKLNFGQFQSFSPPMFPSIQYSIALETKESHLQTFNSKTCYQNYSIFRSQMVIFILNLGFGAIFAPLKCKNPYSFWGLCPQTPTSEIHYQDQPPLFPDSMSDNFYHNYTYSRISSQYLSKVTFSSFLSHGILDYCIEGNIGGEKLCQIWRMTINSPKFNSPIFIPT